MRDFASLKCTNWLVKCNLCALGIGCALEYRFTRPIAPQARTCEHPRAPTQKAALKMRAA